MIKGLECCTNGVNSIPKCEACPYADEQGRCYKLDELHQDALELLKGQDECGWVNVKDKVPDNQRPVIVYVPPHVDGTKGTSLGYVGMAYYTSLGKGFWCGTDGNMYGEIGIIYPPTHWMEPPKEVSGDA